MRKVPLWKVSREVVRLGRQVRRAPGAMWEYLTLTRLYDAKATRQRRIHTGKRSLGGEVAIYLIFPSTGVLTSHLDMLKQLNAHDISPVVVSNLPLSKDDLTTLEPLCARIIERPNIGYDFGGYRDGILSLAANLPEIDRLYILNDSVWMIEAPQSWFDAVRETDVDFCAATSHYGIKRYGADDFREIVWTYTPAHRNYHYASYALSFGHRILRDPDFIRYWRILRLSDSKKRTVRRGEIGLTQWVLERGYSHAASCPTTDLDREIAALDDDALDAVARNLVIPESPRFRVKLDEVLKCPVNSTAGRSDRIHIILAIVGSQPLGYAMPFYTTRYHGFQFLKKSPLWLSRSGSDTMISLLDHLPGPMGRNAAREARALRPDAWPIPSVAGEKEG